jgi:hypothetical protein
VKEPSAEEAALSPLSVTSINQSTKLGMFNPVTPSGTLIVNQVVVTTYTAQAAERMPAQLGQAFSIMNGVSE